MGAMLAEFPGFPEFDPARDALFLDFDGTLVEIAPRPDAVAVPAGLPALLARAHAAASGALAVVSGRSLDQLERYLPGFPGELLGSHGAERRGAASAAVPGIESLHAALEAAARRNGLLAELKPLGGALHYREAPQREDGARALARDIAARHPGFAVQPAKMAFEVRPEGIGKDSALARLAAAPPFAGRRPVYLGDDATDEPAMEWVQARGGVAVKVGAGPSVARHRLPGPRAVLDWIAAPLAER